MFCLLPANPTHSFFMADRWNPQNAIDGRYVWLPIEFTHTPDGYETIQVPWKERWDLSDFS